MRRYYKMQQNIHEILLDEFLVYVKIPIKTGVDRFWCPSCFRVYCPNTVAQNSQSEAVNKKIPVGVGVSVLSFLSRDHTKCSILEAKG